jgi:hypothetical protein
MVYLMKLSTVQFMQAYRERGQGQVKNFFGPLSKGRLVSRFLHKFLLICKKTKIYALLSAWSENLMQDIPMCF